MNEKIYDEIVSTKQNGLLFWLCFHNRLCCCNWSIFIFFVQPETRAHCMRLKTTESGGAT